MFILAIPSHRKRYAALSERGPSLNKTNKSKRLSFRAKAAEILCFAVGVKTLRLSWFYLACPAEGVEGFEVIVTRLVTRDFQLCTFNSDLLTPTLPRILICHGHL